MSATSYFHSRIALKNDMGRIAQETKKEISFINFSLLFSNQLAISCDNKAIDWILQSCWIDFLFYLFHHCSFIHTFILAWWYLNEISLNQKPIFIHKFACGGIFGHKLKIVFVIEKWQIKPLPRLWLHRINRVSDASSDENSWKKLNANIFFISIVGLKVKVKAF